MPPSIIPARLDDPAKVLYFDADVAMTFGFGLFTGIVMFDSIPIGVLLGGVLGWGWHKIKSGKHPAFHLHLLYWHTPMGMKRTPKSYLREFVG